MVIRKISGIGQIKIIQARSPGNETAPADFKGLKNKREGEKVKSVFNVHIFGTIFCRNRHSSTPSFAKRPFRARRVSFFHSDFFTGASTYFHSARERFVVEFPACLSGSEEFIFEWFLRLCLCIVVLSFFYCLFSVVVIMAEEKASVCAEFENGGKVNGAAKEPSFSLLKPHLIVEAPFAVDAIQFYKKAYGAEEVARSYHPKRKADQELPLILHAHLKFGGAEIMVCDEAEEAGFEVKSPVTLKGTTAILHLETSDVDVAFKRAVEAGATVYEEIANRSWGQRYGKLKDPFGFIWSLATPLKGAGTEEADGQV